MFVYGRCYLIPMTLGWGIKVNKNIKTYLKLLTLRINNYLQLQKTYFKSTYAWYIYWGKKSRIRRTKKDVGRYFVSKNI